MSQNLTKGLRGHFTEFDNKKLKQFPKTTFFDIIPIFGLSYKI